MGRHKLPEGQRREYLTVRLPKYRLLQLQKRVKESGLNRSKFVEQVLFPKECHEFP